MIVKHMTEPLKSPRAVNPSVPYPVASAIQKMMAKRPGERFQDYDALIRELERAQSFAVAEPAAPPVAGARPAVQPQTWSGMTGAAVRPRAGRPGWAAAAPPGEAPATAGGTPWILIVLAVLLGSLVVAGVAKRRHDLLTAAREGMQENADPASPGRPGGGSIETQMS